VLASAVGETQRFFSQTALLGTTEEIGRSGRIRRVAVHYYNIARPFMSHYYWPHRADGPTSLASTKTHVASFRVDEATIDLLFTLARSHSTDGTTETYYAFPWFELSFLESTTLERVAELVNMLEGGLAILTARRVVPRNVQVYFDSELAIPGKATFVAGRRGTDSELRHQKRSYVLEELLALGTLGEVLQRWCDRHQSLEAATLLLASDWYNPVPAETSFLLGAQAAEAFHRSARPNSGHFVGADEYGRVRTALVEAIPPGINRDLRKSLELMLQYGNQRSLRFRLSALVRELDPRCRGALDKRWVSNVVGMRNSLTHHGDGKWPLRSSADVTRLGRLDQQVRALVHLHVLLDVGVPFEPAVAELWSKYGVFSPLERDS
jgi:hypothetical protein